MTKPTVMALAWYKADQWDRVRACSADRDKMDEKYEDWERGAKKGLAEMRGRGMDVRPVDVDVDAIVAWAARKGLKVDGKTRTEFAIQLLACSLGFKADL